MAARGVALAAVALLAAGCGGRLYSNADAARAARAPRLPRLVNVQPFATSAAITELEIDVTPPTAAWGNDDLFVYRFPTPEAAESLMRTIDERTRAVVTVVRRRNLVLYGGRAAVAAALRRLPK